MIYQLEPFIRIALVLVFLVIPLVWLLSLGIAELIKPANKPKLVKLKLRRRGAVHYRINWKKTDYARHIRGVDGGRGILPDPAWRRHMRRKNS